MSRAFKYCECGRAIKVKKAKDRRHSHNWNSHKPTKDHDKCSQCWRAILDRNRANPENPYLPMTDAPL